MRVHRKNPRNKPIKEPRQVDRQSQAAQIDTILLYGTFGLLMFGPVAFGAVEPWSTFILEAGSVVLMSLWLRKQFLDGDLTIEWNPLFLPMSGFGLLILLQIVFGISAYRHDTISGALLYCAYAMLCFLSAQTLLRSSQARIIAVVLALYGFTIAAFALLQGIAPNGKLFWVRQPSMGGAIYGPYVNHNHYAGLMEMLVPILLVLSLTRLAGEKERMAAGVAAAIMIGTVFLSGSRGGMLAIFVELAFFAVVLLGQRRNPRIVVGAVVFAVVLVGLLTWLGGKELTSRVSSISTEARTELSGGTRLSIDRDALRMFGNKPVFGWGLGTFPVVYPQYRSFYTNFFVNEAHNDYLQLLAEMGLLGFGTMVWFIIVLYRSAMPKIANWTSDVSGAVTLACTLGFTGILVHSLLDFNLQIPANAALFYVLCTIAAAKPLLQRSKKRRPASTEKEEMFRASEVV
ncbi:MAG: O-antigen ligase family protein [Candidatus Sulfotelmatobacter sp.]|jgi:O-antigen ligase